MLPAASRVAMCRAGLRAFTTSAIARSATGGRRSAIALAQPNYSVQGVNNNAGGSSLALSDSLRRGAVTPDQLTIARLLATGLHLGHAQELWHPLNLPYIFGTRANIHIINLELTLTHLRRACRVVRDVAHNNGVILFIGTRPNIQHLPVAAARRCNGYYVSQRWVAGTITNAHKLLRRSQEQSAMVSGVEEKVELELKPVIDEGASEEEEYEEGSLAAMRQRQKPVHRPDLMIVLNPLENRIALAEAQRMHIPTIGLIDTDCDPRIVTYPIPGNDDSLRAVELVSGVLSMAARDGMQARESELGRSSMAAAITAGMTQETQYTDTDADELRI